MFDWILHLIGFCPDHAAHANLIDYITYIGTGIVTGGWIFFKVLFHKIFHKKCDCKHEEIIKNNKLKQEKINDPRGFSK